MEHYSAVKMNKLLVNTMTGMNLKNITLSEKRWIKEGVCAA